MLRRFILQCLVLSVPIIIGLAGYLWWNRAYLPAPMLTANTALNEKIDLIARTRKDGVKVLALGSSMTLNNLTSAAVVEHFGTDRYVNAGAWGMGASEVERLGSILVDRLTPDAVIVVLNPVDFVKGSGLSAQDSAAIATALRDSGSALGYLRHRDATYYLRQLESNRIRFTDPGNYEYLRFDPYGGATLQVPGERIVAARYNEIPPAPAALQEGRYQAFERFAQALRDRHIDLIVMAAPYRAGLLSAEVQAMQHEHLDRLSAVLTTHRHTLLNGCDTIWSDTLFADANHFGQEGAEAFTEYCLRQLKDR